MRIKQYLKATCHILGLVIYIIALPLMSIYLYKNNSKCAQRFYYCMCSHQVFRMLYCIIFAGGIATLNMLYTYNTHRYTFAALTLAVSLPLLLDKLGQPLLASLRKSRQMLYLLMLIALASMFTDGLFTFAASLYLLLVAACFYPSRRAIEKFQNYSSIHFYQQCPDTLMEEYFK